MKPKSCPNCNEPNSPEVKFCVKCRMVLSYDSWQQAKVIDVDFAKVTEC